MNKHGKQGVNNNKIALVSTSSANLLSRHFGHSPCLHSTCLLSVTACNCISAPICVTAFHQQLCWCFHLKNLEMKADGIILKAVVLKVGLGETLRGS